MTFDNLVNSYLTEMASRGRPKRLFVPTEKAFSVTFPPHSVEAQIINYLDETPATLQELISFLRQNHDEYFKASACKEKIQQMLKKKLLSFKTKDGGDSEAGEIPALDVDEEDPYDVSSYLPKGAIQDYMQSLPGQW